MPLAPLPIEVCGLDDETSRAVKLAFEMTRIALHLTHPTDPEIEAVAKRIIALAKEGELNPDRLCQLALNEVSGALFQPTPRPI